MKCAIYVRVSTNKQKYAMQIPELVEFCARMGWERTDYTDIDSTRNVRPALDQLMADARKRKFDVVLCWKLDRFGRSVMELSTNIQALDGLGIRFIIPGQGIDTDKSNPVSRLLINVLSAIAEFERDLIRERTMAGSEDYKRDFEAGKVGVGKARESKSKKNLAPGRPKKVFRRDEAEKLRKLGHSWRAISKHIGISATTIRDALSR
ncbi:MAG: recombinase family protein [Ignavibacteriota bacterium]